MREADAMIEQGLQAVVDRAIGQDSPPRLASALRYAVFPGGARIRPKLCLAIAAAHGGSDPTLAGAAAAAIELLHCASLVHDDLPCFDDAELRRGKPAVHVAYGEDLAILTGDALIVMAFETLAMAAAAASHPERLPQLMTLIGNGVGAPRGITAGQAWELEPDVDLSRYHQAKTGSLFVAATCAGAAAAGVDVMPWRRLGECIGESYQVADDIRDATGDAKVLGKPTGKDRQLGRPSAVTELGLEGAVSRLKCLVEAGLDSIPACPGRARLKILIRDEAKRFLPRKPTRQAA